MCQLLAVIANRPVDIALSLREFRHRGAVNSHGWGFAFIENGSWRVIKKPAPLPDENINARKFQFKSPVILGHVRLASCGNHTHPNTHPFSAGAWAFAHNGTVSGIMKDPGFALNRHFPEGETDSEYAFCRLLQAMEDNPDDCASALADEAARIRKTGRFNFIMSDGTSLFVHGDDSLYFTERRSPFRLVTLQDDEYEARLADFKREDERAVIVATEPITRGEKWEKLSGLKVWKDV